MIDPNTKAQKFPAFPAGRQSHEVYGLTKEEYFTALAMQSLIIAKPEASADEIAKDAALLARATLKQLGKWDDQQKNVENDEFSR